MSLLLRDGGWSEEPLRGAAEFEAFAAFVGAGDAGAGAVAADAAQLPGGPIGERLARVVTDADGLGPISYQWQANGADIAGATSAGLVLGQSEVGKTITVVARYTDLQGTVESVSSAATPAVANVNDAPAGTVNITGTPTQGQTLTASNNLTDADGLGTITYQWRANGADIVGASTPTLLLGQAHVGRTISVLARYTDLLGTAESVNSTATAAVANINDAPTGTLIITGTPTQGQTLTASNTLADADGLGTITYQWRANGVDIAGATTASYVLTAAEVGRTITVVARYTDGFGFAESMASAATGTVAAAVGVTLNGTATADTLNGTALDDTLNGLAGNDTLNGGAGNDTLDGGTGNDSMVGGAGDDTYVVDVTTDIVVEAANAGTDTVRTALTSYTLGTTNGSANVENLVYTGTAAFTGNGSALNNVITGSTNVDTLNGLAGNDTLDGGAGNDVLNGGAGVDALIGGAGNDRFVFSVITDTGLTAALRDVINDLLVAADRIDVSAIDANTTVAADQAFIWRGTQAINGIGQLSIAYDTLTNTTVISGNVDANLAPDFTIALIGNYTATLGQTDFVL